MTPTNHTADTPPTEAGTLANVPRSEGRGASPFLTTDEAAAYLRTTRGTVYNLVWKGVLPRRRGKLLFTRQELDEYLAGIKPTPKPRRSGTRRG